MLSLLKQARILGTVEGGSLSANLRILLIEDETEIRELMALHILRNGFALDECASAESGLEKIAQQSYALVVVDWMLPGLSGVEFIERLKLKNNTASILMVTAKTEPADIVNGLGKGADDYLTKPFEPSVFIARVKALLRRHESITAESLPRERKIKIGDLTINFDTYDVRLLGEKLHLTPSEYKLLSTMIQKRGKVLTRDELIEQVQGEGVSVVGRTVDTHVFGLRKKLGSWSDQIETLRGIGYRVKID
jgi:two-component system, OmpR family, phosphate regulon response regulator PhoB